MIIYLISAVFFIAVNIMLYIFKCSDKAKLSVNGVMLVIFSGLRSINIGTDVRNYGNIFNTFGRLPLSSDVSKSIDGFPVYRLMCKLIYVIFDGNYQVMLVVSAAIIIYGLFKFIYRYSDNCTASVFYYITLFYFFIAWNIVRQSIAMSLFLLAFISFEEKKYVKCIILGLLASGIHSIALIMFIAFVLTKIRWNKSIFAVYSLCIVLAMSLVPYMMNIFIRIFPRYAMYSNVLSGDISAFGGVAKGRKIVLSIIFLAFIILYFLINRSPVKAIENSENELSEEKNVKDYFWLWASLTMIEIIIGILFSTNTFYGRLQILFSIYSIMLLPTIIERVGKKYRTIIYILTNILFAATTVIRLLGNEADVYPYEFFWQV